MSINNKKKGDMPKGGGAGQTFDILSVIFFVINCYAYLLVFFPITKKKRI